MQGLFRTNKLRLFTVVVFALFAITPLAKGQPYDLSILPNSPLKLADPGETVTHVFIVKNEGTNSDSYNLSLELPDGWTSLPVPENITVAPGGNKPVFANVNVPQGAKAGKYSIKLTAKSTGDPTLKGSGVAEIQVKSVPSLGLAWEVEPSRVSPGETASGKFEITNQGNLPDSYEIEVRVPEGWSYSLQKTEVRLMSGQSTILSVEFTSEESASPGKRYELEIDVISQHDRGLRKTISSTGQIAPPPPEEVSKSLYPSWDIFTDVNMTQEGNPLFYVRGRGIIPQLGEVSADLNYAVDGFKNGSLEIMKDRWGFVLNGSSISGSYLGVNGTPLYMVEMEDISASFLYTEESKGVAVEKVGDNWDMRAVLGTEKDEQSFEFHELQGAYEFSNGVTIDGLITTARTQTQSGTIYGAGLELSDEKVTLYPSFLRVNPGYPNQNPRRELGVSASLEEETFTSYFNWSYAGTRLGQEPGYYHVNENDIEVSTSLDLGENLNSDFSLGFTWRKSDDTPPSNNLFSNSFSASLSGGELLTWAIGTNINRTHDKVSDTITNTNSVDASLGLNIGESEHSVSISLTQADGTSASTTSNTFTISSDFYGFPLSPSFSLSRSSADTIVSANFSEESTKGATLDISFSASLAKQDSVSLSLSTSFPDPFRFCGPSKGQVKGYLFVDSNGNGEKDPSEQSVKDLILTLSERKAVSGEAGKFIFPPVQPGSYQLDIEELTSGLKPTIEIPKTLEVKAGEITEVTIPLRPQTWVVGTVYNDKNQNGSRDPNEGGMSGIVFSIIGEGISREIRSGTNGKFIADLRPGEYQVELIKGSLPERYEPTTPATVSVTTKEFGRTEVEFGVYQKPKPVVVTFGPPTARFTYSPETPALGESIAFDATESSAIETTIESYKWEFSHDETVINREGKVIDVKLEKTGTWEVSLTVTDKNGLKGREIRTIEVESG